MTSCANSRTNTAQILLAAGFVIYFQGIAKRCKILFKAISGAATNTTKIATKLHIFIKYLYKVLQFHRTSKIIDSHATSMCFMYNNWSPLSFRTG